MSFPLKCMSGLFQVFTAVLWLFNMVCWAAKGIPPAGGDETSIQKLNIYEKLNYQNDKRKMLEVLKNPGDYTESLWCFMSSRDYEVLPEKFGIKPCNLFKPFRGQLSFHRVKLLFERD